MTKFLLIGCGQIAHAVHIPSLQQLQRDGQVELCAVCDLDAARAKTTAERFSIAKHGSDWKKLAQECGAQAVGICLPPGPNADVAIAAMEAGLHVLCEKPPGRDVAQAQKLAQAASDHPNLIGMIAFNRRYAPFYLDAMERSQKLGSPHAFYGRFTRSAAGQPPSNTATDWLSSDGSHALDLAVATMGFPHRVSASRRSIGGGPDNVWTIHLETPRGAAAIIFDFAAGRRVERFEWSGPGYDVLLELPQRGVWAQVGVKPEEWDFQAADATASAAGYGFTGEYAALTRAIAGEAARPEADFAYAPDFLQLVQTLLNCPSGESCDVERVKKELAKTEAKKAAPSAVRAWSTPERNTSQPSTPEARAVVQITQLPSEQPKFYPTAHITKLGGLCELHLNSEDEGFAARLERADVLVTGWRSRYATREELERAKNLKLAIVLGVSVNSIFPDMLLERGVQMCSTAEIVARSVAEHCLLLTLAGLRQLSDIDHRMHAGEWPPQPPPPQKPRDLKGRMRYTARGGARFLRQNARHVPGASALKPALSPTLEKMRERLIATGEGGNSFALERHDLRGQTVGILGWGNIARHYARLLQPFGCRLLVHSAHADEAELESLGARIASIGEVFGSCRVVSLHQGLTERTRGSLGAAELALMRPGTLLVNTARAEIFDESALVERLRRGDVLAALDVFHQEPLAADHPLRSMRNVLLSPHNANHTPECFARAGEQALEWVLDWLAGREVPAYDAARLAGMT